MQTTSNASRRITYFHTKWSSRFIKSSFFLKKKSNAGRNISGRKTIRSKGSIKAPIHYAVINYQNTHKLFGFVSNVQLLQKTQSFCFLVVNSNGSIFYKPVGTWRKSFSFIYSHQKSKLFTNLFTSPYSLKLATLALLQPISHLEITPLKGSQYARAPGSVAKALSTNKNTHTALVRLPSGVRKIFSLYNTAVKGASSLKEKKQVGSTKSGYWRSLGYKSKVRGVAMNPIDHPHGGRTKSIKYPRTPWGLTTKFK